MDLILTSYFSKPNGYSQHDSSGGCIPDDYELMRKWHETMHKQNLSGIICHDQLSQEFVNKYTSDKIKFFKWEQNNRPSYNDERFYCYRSLLDTVPADRIICTDLFDVEFHGNPFKKRWHFYTRFGVLHLGSENRTPGSVKWLNKKLSECNLPSLTKKEIIYNAGIIGGDRMPLLKLLDWMIYNLNRTPKQINANTPLYLHYTNRVCKHMILTGAPLHNVFKSGVIEPGVAIKHK